jgi:16S rRNA (cytosine1402-N4)-methyltransferase
VVNVHETVLLHEAVDGLITRPNGVYVDGTFGRGGHSRQILTQLGEQGRLLAIDKDPEAIRAGQMLAAEDSRFTILQGSFADMGSLIKSQGLSVVDGVLLDLGVSSPQLDQSERGFSFMRDGPLDMRMDPTSGQSAAEWLAVAGEDEIRRVLKDFGEERYALRLARAIIAERQQSPINSTLRLAKLITDAHPAWERGKHPATKTFQAIRIFINNELGDLELLLASLLDLLVVEGRMAVISFHSLEDRMVKRFIKRHVRGDDLPANVPVRADQLNRRLKQVGKAVRAEQQEVESNVRSRSAIMRIAEKIA